MSEEEEEEEKKKKTTSFKKIMAVIKTWHQKRKREEEEEEEEEKEELPPPVKVETKKTKKVPRESQKIFQNCTTINITCEQFRHVLRVKVAKKKAGPEKAYDEI